MTYKYDKVLVQGITGREGQRAVAFMKQYYTTVIAGVTPGKAGQSIDGIPVFDSVVDAQNAVGACSVTSIYVPPEAALAAVKEAAEAGISYIHLLTESIPLRDCATMIAVANDHGSVLLGPGSLGVMRIGDGRIGFVGGDKPETVYLPGSVSLISRSGGMTNEIGRHLSAQGVGFRDMIHLGSERIQGITMLDQLDACLQDGGTDAVLVFEELINQNLQPLIDYFASRKTTSNVCFTFAGTSQNLLPSGVAFGHADALLKQDFKSLKEKLEQLSQYVSIVPTYQDFLKFLYNL